VTVAPAQVTTAVPALYETTIHHVRQTPFKHAFTYKSYWWLVDLDHLPELPRGLRSLAVFRASDHVGTTASLRQNVDALLAAEGLSCDRVLMLSNARTLGHVFNPISVHWCFSDTGEVVAVVAEVHNTYAGRHAYVLRVDADGRAATDKVFYVSPFHQVDGHYEMRLPVPGDELRIDLTYHRPGSKPFVATVRGTRTPVTPRTVLATALRHPLSTRTVSLRIRLQGIRLYLRRLPVVPRTPATTTPKEQTS
jgi:DUF1365 family protein